MSRERYAVEVAKSLRYWFILLMRSLRDFVFLVYSLSLSLLFC